MKEKLQHIETNDLYVVDSLTHSIPYLIKGAAQLLDTIGTNFLDSLTAKGAYSVVITPQGKCYFNTTGNPGMATGGSGDVLTGVVLALLAQGYASEDAACLAMYVHGLAGDIACKMIYVPDVRANSRAFVKRS